MTDETQFKKRNRVRKRRMSRFIRNRFFTGAIIALPIAATISLVTWIVQVVDNNVLRFLPAVIDPATYLGFQIPGLGLIIGLLLVFLLGLFATNIIGKSVLSAGELIVDRLPVISPVYNALKQIVRTVAAQKDRAFRDVCLIEYPRKGLWAIGFVTADLQGAPKKELDGEYVCVFVPTTPNPTSGFLLFVKTSDIKILDMTPEEGAKMIISGGMVSNEQNVALDAGTGLEFDEKPFDGLNP